MYKYPLNSFERQCVFDNSCKLNVTVYCRCMNVYEVLMHFFQQVQLLCVAPKNRDEE